MYVYTDSPNDMGNVASIPEMIEQFSYLMAPDKMGRVLMPGRSVFVHITQGVAQLGRDGYVGLKDFRGDVIHMMEGHGWIYYGEVTIDKNPQVKAIRTRDAGLTFKSLATDAAQDAPRAGGYSAAIPQAWAELRAHPCRPIGEIWQHHWLGDKRRLDTVGQAGMVCRRLPTAWA